MQCRHTDNCTWKARANKLSHPFFLQGRHAAALYRNLGSIPLCMTCIVFSLADGRCLLWNCGLFAPQRPKPFFRQPSCYVVVDPYSQLVRIVYECPVFGQAAPAQSMDACQKAWVSVLAESNCIYCLHRRQWETWHKY